MLREGTIRYVEGTTSFKERTTNCQEGTICHEEGTTLYQGKERPCVWQERLGIWKERSRMRKEGTTHISVSEGSIDSKGTYWGRPICLMTESPVMLLPADAHMTVFSLYIHASFILHHRHQSISLRRPQQLLQLALLLLLFLLLGRLPRTMRRRMLRLRLLL